MSQLIIERLHAHLSQVGLTQADAVLEAHLERAAKQDPGYAQFLLELLDAENEHRTSRILQTRMRMAALPYVKTIGQFDFSFQPSIDERLVKDLQTLRFVSEFANVILLGPPGVGKTHLAVGLAVAAMQGGFSCHFTTAQDLTTDLGHAAREGTLARRMKVYNRARVLIIDEVGYLPLDPVGATVLFQLISLRYERGSIILTSNKSYTEWGAVFGDQTIAAAILDRLLHHSTTINIRGESYRLKERKKAGLFASAALSEEGAAKRNVTHRSGGEHAATS